MCMVGGSRRRRRAPVGSFWPNGRDSLSDDDACVWPSYYKSRARSSYQTAIVMMVHVSDAIGGHNYSIDAYASFEMFFEVERQAWLPAERMVKTGCFRFDIAIGNECADHSAVNCSYSFNPRGVRAGRQCAASMFFVVVERQREKSVHRFDNLHIFVLDRGTAAIGAKVVRSAMVYTPSHMSHPLWHSSTGWSMTAVVVVVARLPSCKCRRTPVGRLLS